MPKTLVRNAVNTDFPTLLKIDKDSFPPGIAYDFAELSYFMRRKGAHTLVAEVASQIVGFLLMEVVARRKSATLVTLDIRQDHRRHGFATELLTRSQAILRDLSIARYQLQVDTGNEAALKFYRKHGFDVVSTLPNYYSNGNDAYLMVKDLT